MEIVSRNASAPIFNITKVAFTERNYLSLNNALFTISSVQEKL